MNRLNKTESAIFVSLVCSLLLEDLQTELIFIFTELVLCHVAAVKRLPVYQYSADYIFRSFGIIGLNLCQFENSVRMKSALGEGEGGAWAVLPHFITAHEQTHKTVSAIFVSLMCSLLPEDLHSELIIQSR